MRRLRRILWLAVKEVASLRRDRVMLGLLIYAFTVAVMMEATGAGTSVHNASIGFVDEDRSALTRAMAEAFRPPEFQPPELIDAGEVDAAMDGGRFLFVVMAPPRFEADLRAGLSPELQVLVDATAMEQAGIGYGYVARILSDEIARAAEASAARPAIDLVIHSAFNPNRDPTRFRSVIALVSHLTLMATVLTGAAIMREREHGTIEHLLAMPLTPLDIAAAKILANAAVVLVAAALSLVVVVQWLLGAGLEGSKPLFLAGAALYLFSAAALGVFLATVTRSMAQFALLTILAIMAIQFLSGGETPVEAQPEWLQALTLALPARHFIEASQAILFKQAGLADVAPAFIAIAALGAVLLAASLVRFRRAFAEGG
jgi:ABC-2 type transport system permease protein